MLAVRSNERAAAVIGINVRGVKMMAFGISACIAGLAGSLYAYNFGSVSADRFDVVTALSLIAFAYLAGITSVFGAIVAGLLSTEGLVPYGLDRLFGISGDWLVLLGGGSLIIILARYPEGLAGVVGGRLRARRGPARRRVRRDRHVVAEL
jgi:branched-chain amino acid transport system permease protein